MSAVPRGESGATRESLKTAGTGGRAKRLNTGNYAGSDKRQKQG